MSGAKFKKKQNIWEKAQKKKKRGGQAMFPVSATFGDSFAECHFYPQGKIEVIFLQPGCLVFTCSFLFSDSFHLLNLAFALSPVSMYQGSVTNWRFSGGVAVGSDRAGNSKSMTGKSTMCRLPASFTHSWMWMILKGPNSPVSVVIFKYSLWSGLGDGTWQITVNQ